MATRHRYDRQAETYDATRAAGPSVLGPVLEALAGAPGPELLDVGGGTGNYAQALLAHGFSPTVLDYNEAMLARARAKGLPVLQGDAAALPFAGETWDAVMMISMLHHVTDWAGALREAVRVLRPGGRLAVMGWAREHVEEVGWIHEYFPSTRPWMVEQHPGMRELLALLPGARVLPVRFDDSTDLSLGALQRRPEQLLDPELRRQTSYFERLADSEPAELAAGLERLQRDLAAGRRPQEERAEARARLGDAGVLAYRKR
ncbi:MAG: hypothetical protein AVDCRST_MAG30-3573 [uncultured Solirubrobacteraceae bacterium]|uniref:Methyltransferase type 11 domain-containing protein n=1 Tax=uncultured Solirubrobacteraceae bacterium TaxID=1162706 RepID=A0A6J4TPI4_9ACTN|nr:MAG: hypothetical protein AVDCRST_MAG30-3573 [uncultured Solirubrobacteraceae bacterium]